MYKVRPLKKQDLFSLKEFTDRSIGTDYYSLKELEEIYYKSIKNDVIFTLLLVDARDQIHGVRITYPSGNWQKGKGRGLNPKLWNVDFEDVAYFQSLFISEELTGQGWGKKISETAIEMLKTIGTRAIVTHSWQESPHGSSGRYLRSLGFESVAVHPFYWKDVDYVCTRCGKPCLCTAEEMILKL